MRVIWPDGNGGRGGIVNWITAAAMVDADPELASAVSALAAHYPGGSRTCPACGTDFRCTCDNGSAFKTNKPLWNSEAWGDGGTGTDEGGATLARQLNWEPLVGKISSTIVWQILWGNYDGISWTNNALLRANSPWVGSYTMLSPGYAVQHHTHFARPGWRYLRERSGIGFLGGGGSYVTLVSPDQPSAGEQRDFSMVIETFDRDVSRQTIRFPASAQWNVSQSQNLRFRLVQPGCESWGPLMRVVSQPFFANGTAKNGDADAYWFQPASPVSLTPGSAGSGDCFMQLTVLRNTMTTISTVGHPLQGIRGRQAEVRSQPWPKPPVELPFPLPWSADFAGSSKGRMPSFFADLNGAFSLGVPFDAVNEITTATKAEAEAEGAADLSESGADANARGRAVAPVMVQRAQYVPIMWSAAYGQAKFPLTIFGNHTWTNYTVTAQVALISPPLSGPTGPFQWESRVTSQGLQVSGENACNDPLSWPLNCTWANTSATVAVRVGAGSGPWGWIKCGFGYFFTVAASGEWQVTAGVGTRQLPPPPPPPPKLPCPDGWLPHEGGYWSNSYPHDNHGDQQNATTPLCANKCEHTAGCVAFEVYDGPRYTPACYMFLGSMQLPFTANSGCTTCIRRNGSLQSGGAEESVQANLSSSSGASVRVLARGRLTEGLGLRKWRTIALSAVGCQITAEVDGAVVSQEEDTGCTGEGGWGAVGSGWHETQLKAVHVASAAA